MDSVFIDETFDLNQTRNYHISIRAGLDGYSFSVLDPLRNKYILLKHFNFPPELTLSDLEDKICELNKNDEFLSREYKSAYFAYQSAKYTLIPAPLFKKDNLRKYFEFNHYLDDLDEIHYNRLRNIDAYNLFVIPSGVAGEMKKAFENIRYFHHVTPFIENGILQHGGKGTRRSVLINVHGKYAEIVVLQGDKMLLCNTFPWKSDEDLVFYILYVYEQLKLGGEDIPLIISGEMHKRSTTYDMLKGYIKNISFEKRNEQYLYSYTFNEIDQHWFNNLFNLRMCV